MNRQPRVIVSLAIAACLAVCVAGCGTEGLSGNATFSVGAGWDGDSTVPIAMGSVFSATSREPGLFGKSLRLESDNLAIIAPVTGGQANTWEAVGPGTCSLVARTEAGTELDRMTLEVAAVATVDAGHWADLSFDAGAVLPTTVGAVSNANIQLKIIVRDAAGRVMRHEQVASLVSDSGAPVNIDPGSPTTLVIGASGQGAFSVKALVKGGSAVLKAYKLNVIAPSDVNVITIASGPIVLSDADTSEANSGSTSKLHLVYARCSEPTGQRVYGCKPAWTRTAGEQLTLIQSSAYQWVPLDIGQSVTLQATLTNATATAQVDYGVTNK